MGAIPPTLRLVGIGWYIALCIILGVGGGVWLDRRFDLTPLFTMTGLFLGLAAAFLGGYLLIVDVLKAIEQKGKAR
jgi:F0F1-type ATP synthase assembly protein I